MAYNQRIGTRLIVIGSDFKPTPGFKGIGYYDWSLVDVKTGEVYGVYDTFKQAIKAGRKKQMEMENDRQSD